MVSSIKARFISTLLSKLQISKHFQNADDNIKLARSQMVFELKYADLPVTICVSVLVRLKHTYIILKPKEIKILRNQNLSIPNVMFVPFNINLKNHIR
jgi:hypothetical protein